MNKKSMFCLAGCASAVLLCSPVMAEETKEAVLSDDIYSFSLLLDGDLYEFPMSYEDFTALGWEYKDDAGTEISPNQYSPSETFSKGNLDAYAKIINLGINTLPVSECTVGGLSIDSWQFEDAPDTVIEFPKGIVFGKSTLEDIKAAYGEPSDTYEGDLYTMLSYEYDYYQEIEFYVDKETGVIDEFDIENFVVDEESNAAAAAEVSSDPTEEVLAYTAPTELGDDLLSFIVEYAGDLYQLPAPVSVFLENGWTLKEKDSDSVIAGKDFGWVYMMKDNQEYHSTVRNYSPNAAAIENCFVTSVESSVDSTNLPITIQKGITLGMSNEDLLAALEGEDYETDDSSDMFIYYTIEGKESSLDGIQILVKREDNAVTSIEVEYEPDTLS
ncbi:MAG: hypothetical protein Q4C50_10075 [Eubacteriales bacterium]|nr:hypothetical protein [Eubacteriales bacterium]